jgi:putative transcriptional regulator
VAQARRKRGLSQRELGRLAGVSRQTIVEVEGGDYNPSTALALRLAVLLGAHVEDLFQLPEAEMRGLAALRDSDVPGPRT